MTHDLDKIKHALLLLTDTPKMDRCRKTWPEPVPKIAAKKISTFF